MQSAIPENIHPPLTEEIGTSFGRGVPKTKTFKEMYQA